MQQTTVSFSIRSPAKVGGGIDGTFGCLAKQMGGPKREEAAREAPERDLVDWPGRLACATPYALIGIRKQGVDNLTKPRPAVALIFVRKLLDAEVCHDDTRASPKMAFTLAGSLSHRAFPFVLDVERLVRVFELRHQDGDVTLDRRRFVGVGVHDARLDDRDRVLGQNEIVEAVL